MAKVPPQGARVHPLALVTAAPSGIYLGAQVNPNYKPGQGTFAEQEIETEALEASIGRHLALHMEYRLWSDLPNPALQGNLMNDPEFAGDVANGRVPVISLHCLDDVNGNNYNLYQISLGAANTDLAAIRAALLTLKYKDGRPYPVMLRYFWEFNLNAADINGTENGNGGCFVPSSQAGGEALPTQFVNAWGVIHQQLLGNSSPVPEITFVWNPLVADTANLDPSPSDFDGYFPQGLVDWVGADGYSKAPTGSNPLSFTGVFNGFITDILGNAQYGQLPILIGETGSCNGYSYPYDQGDYIEGAESVLDLSNSSPSYARVRGFMYFDAQGDYSYKGRTCDWSLDGPPQNPAITGLAAFTALGADPSFQPMVTEQ